MGEAQGILGNPGVGLIAMLVIGAIAGWIAEKVTASDHGIFTNILVGIAGAFIAGKLAELKTFLTEVRSELRRVTWPPKTEVYPTTIVVIVTTIIFGVLLYGVDVIFSRGLAALLSQV